MDCSNWIFGNVVDAIIEELRPTACLRDVTQFWQFRSTVPGPSLRAASQFLCERHSQNGLETEVIAYPADDRTEFVDGRRNPLEWVPRSAALWMVGDEDELLCRYEEEPLCLVSNSTGTPKDGTVAPVVIVDRANEEGAYEGVDVEGRIVLTDLSPMVVGQLARKHGAVGLVSDSVCPPWLADHPPMRRGADVPDLTMWSILNGHRQERGLWGFSLTPRQGARLRQRLRESAGMLQLRAEVDAEMVEGHSEMVSALLPGTDLADQEIWVLSHSSEPGALDNASGCCLGVELGRAIKVLVESGRLPPLRRSIRFLSGVEVEGFLPYLHQRREELGKVVAGLCLDSVGMDFRQSGGSLELMTTPDENPSFADGLLDHLFRMVAEQPNERFGADSYDLFAWSRAPFWGNDGFVSEGYFDIPTPQMSCWPDKFYHSSLDTPDKLSPISMGRGGAIAGAYLYVLAAAGEEEARHCANLGALDWKRRIAGRMDEAVAVLDTADGDGASSLPGLSRHMSLLAGDAVHGALVLSPDDLALREQVEMISGDLTRFAEEEMRRVARLIGAGIGLNGEADEDASSLEVNAGPRWRPLRWGRPGDRQLSPEGRERLSELRAAPGRVERAWPWINGRRTTGEICARLELGGAVELASVEGYLELMEREGFLGRE